MYKLSTSFDFTESFIKTNKNILQLFSIYKAMIWNTIINFFRILS